jgi:hypothetical protein
MTAQIYDLAEIRAAMRAKLEQALEYDLASVFEEDECYREQLRILGRVYRRKALGGAGRDIGEGALARSVSPGVD